MSEEKLETELFTSKTEPLGVDSVDFILENATYIRVQTLVRGAYKVIPQQLVEDIAELIREYKFSPEEMKWMQQQKN